MHSSLISKPLLFGKNPTQRLIGVEVQDGEATLFLDNHGTLITTTLPNKYWFLSNASYPMKSTQNCSPWICLEGKQYYKYGKQCSTKEAFLETRARLRKKDLFLFASAKEATLVNKGITYFKGMDIGDLSTFAFDIETTGLHPKSKDAFLVLIATTFKTKQHKKVTRLFSFDAFSSQAEMLDAFCAYVRECNPMILLGHNINGFDLPYLQTLATQHGTKLFLGRDGSPARFDTREAKFRKEASQFLHYHRCHVYGREVIDTLFLSIKYDIAKRKYTSYGLKNIIQQEGLERQERVFYDPTKIKSQYKNPKEMELIKAYCKDDAEDALALFDLMAPSQFFLTQYVSKTFQAVTESASGSQLNSIMVRAYLQNKHSIAKASEVIPFEGAISLGNPGIYSNVLKFDVASMYPSIMMQYGIFNKQKDPEGYLMQLLQTLRSERLKNKDLGKTSLYHQALQESQKALVNSMFGFLGAPGLNYNYPEGAAEITKLGREILNKAIAWSRSQGVNLTDGSTQAP